MPGIYKNWKADWHAKNGPLWLLELSRSVVGDPDGRPMQDTAISNYIERFSSKQIPEFDSPEFIQHVDAKHQDFFKIIQKEARSYYHAFHTNGNKNVYAQEVINQIQNTYGPSAVNKFIYNQDSMQGSIGNMVVALAINAIRDMALVEHLHMQGNLTDAERDAGFAEIDKRISRIGINGIDRFFESNPELEQFMANNTFSTIETKRSVGVLKDSWTRAAYYRHQMEKSKNLPDDLKTKCKEATISDNFPDIEDEKDHYIRVHVKEVPELDTAIRKKYSPLSLTWENAPDGYFKQHKAVLDELQADRERHDQRSTTHARQAALRDGLAVNHPLRDKYADSLRNRMKGISTNDIIDVQIIDSKEPRQLSGKSKLLLEENAGGRGSHLKRLGYGSGSDKDQHKKKEDSGHSTEGAAGNPDKPSNVGAAIATIGGTAAVGLLLASGNKDKDGKDGEDKEKSKGRALKFAALAGAAAVAVGGLIMWTKKPEFLYKPMNDLFKNLGFGRA